MTSAVLPSAEAERWLEVRVETRFKLLGHPVHPMLIDASSSLRTSGVAEVPDQRVG